MAELLAFLSIERSMGRIGYNTVQKKLAPVERHVHAAAVAGEHAKAADLIEAINLGPEVATIQKHLSMYMKSAFVLGASLACGGMDRTPKNVAKLLDPAILSTVTKVHAEIVTLRNEQLIRRYAGNVIADHHAEHNDVHKAEWRRKEEALDLADLLNNAVDGTTKMMASISANLSTSRLVSYGFLSTADAIGITKYELQAVLDDRTSEICQALDGRIFEVQRALDYAERVLKTSDPESLKSVAPFLKGTKGSISHLKEASDSELQAEGVMVPPFHPNCRTVLVNLSTGSEVGGDFGSIAAIASDVYDLINSTKNEHDPKTGEFMPGKSTGFTRSDDGFGEFGSRQNTSETTLAVSPLPVIDEMSNPLVVLKPTRGDVIDKVKVVSNVDVRELYVWQGTVEPEKIRPTTEDLPPIRVYKINGKLIVGDGNHRAVSAFLEGRHDIPAYVADFDAPENQKYWKPKFRKN